MTIIVSKAGKNAVRVPKTSIAKETFLQEYIHANPKSIPLDEIKPGIDLDRLLVVREFPTESGPIDALLIDDSGDVFLVETKLYKNPDKRLVVAQILDYGASLTSTYRTLDQFANVLGNAVAKDIGLHEYVKRTLGFGDEEADVLLERAWGNLRDGTYKFVVLMDTLEERLKDLILFLNKMSDFALFAVEVDYYEHEGYEIMRPRLFGVEARDAGGTRESRSWDESSFLQETSRRVGTGHLGAVKKLLEFSKRPPGRIEWGTGRKEGSLTVKFDRISVRSLYIVQTNGSLNIPFGWLDDNEATEKLRDEFRRLLQGIAGFQAVASSRDFFFRLPAEMWCPVVDDFIGAVETLLRGAPS
ncbi:MAG TPA: hypothetical protein VNN18_02515 [Candidatus Xenobia bacterium]|nr:hypothetical protein [Candidatus Xenobia bacterium]